MWGILLEGEASPLRLHILEGLHVALQPWEQVQVGVVPNLLVVEERWGVVFP